MSDKDTKKDQSTLGQARDLAKQAIDRAMDSLARPEHAQGQDEAARAASEDHARAEAAIRAELGGPTGKGLAPTPLSGIGHSPSVRPPAAAPPTPPQEPFGMLDLEEPPERYGIDEVMVLARDPHTLFAYWEVTEEGKGAARASLGGDGRLVLRVYAVTVRAEGGLLTETIDHELDWDHGRRYFGAPRPGAHVSAAVGLRAADGRFAPIAQAPRIRVPYAEPGPAGPVEWMDVKPARSRGEELEPPQIQSSGPGPQVVPIPGLGVGLGLGGGDLPPREGGGTWVGSARVPGPHEAAPRSGVPSSPSSPWRTRQR